MVCDGYFIFAKVSKISFHKGCKAQKLGGSLPLRPRIHNPSLLYHKLNGEIVLQHVMSCTFWMKY